MHCLVLLLNANSRFSVSLTNRLTWPGAANTRKRGLRVEANTLWSLTPDKKWCDKKPECCKKLAPVDLTEAIGSKRLVRPWPVGPGVRGALDGLGTFHPAYADL